MNATLILPELFVAGAAMALLLAGAFLGARGAGAVQGGAGAALLIALVLLLFPDALGLAKEGPANGKMFAFGGMLAMDGFRQFVKAMLLVAGAGCLDLGGFIWRKDENAGEYPVLVMLAILGMMLMVSAADWIALYVGLEMQSLALYILVSLNKADKRSSEAGLKYFMLGAFSSAIMLFGLSLLYGFAGGTGYDATAQALAAAQQAGGGWPLGVSLALAFVLAGFAFKISAAPFHMWTPDVYEGASAPVTAFLAAAPKMAAMGAFVLLLTGPLAAAAPVWQPALMALAVLSMVVGSVGALAQTNIKRLMAYSAIGNVGAILVGLVCFEKTGGAASLEGLSGALLYLALYVFGVIGVFASLACVRKDGKPVEALRDLAGLGAARPLLAAALAASLFSLAGVPPLAGFFGKYFVFLAAVHAGLWPLALIGVLASVVAVGYTLLIVKRIYFDKLEGFLFDRVPEKTVAATAVVVALFVSVFILMPAPLLSDVRRAAESLLLP